MNILAINGHPDKESFVSALFQKYIENVDKSRHELRVLELSSMKFDPVLRFGYRKRMQPDQDIELSQEYLKWADHIAFFYPIWFGTVPSLLKGWFERVISPGYAFNMDGFKINKYLKGKTAHLIFTSGSPVFWQKISGNLECRLVKRVLNFCGIKTVMVDRLGLVSEKFGSVEKRKKFLELIGKRAGKYTG
ncbi:MAG: NAD(P)H-dependent oxidoreductase [Treponema sp.]|nr:NAD(P)H-dependent oxidoreductase [Treponema sp.]